MARVKIYETIQDSAGNGITGASVYVYTARTTSTVVVYTNETGGATLTQPLTTTTGTIPGWVEEAELDLAYSGTGITSGTRRFNAIVGGDPKLGSDSVGAAQIAADAVGSSEIAAGAVNTGELADGAVTASKIGPLEVTSSKIEADSITNSKMHDDAVNTDELVDGAVTNDKIADSTISGGKIIPSGVSTSRIADDAVTSAKLNLSRDSDTPSADTPLISISSSSITGLVCTAPSTGTYAITASLVFELTDPVSDGPSQWTANLYLNGSTFGAPTMYWKDDGVAASKQTVSVACLASLTAGDLVSAKAKAGGLTAVTKVLAAGTRIDILRID